jgi:phage gp36-like protein
MALSEQLAERSAELSVKTEQQSGALVQTAANMDEIAAARVTMPIIRVWRVLRPILQHYAPGRAVI